MKKCTCLRFVHVRNLKLRGVREASICSNGKISSTNKDKSFQVHLVDVRHWHFLKEGLVEQRADGGRVPQRAEDTDGGDKDDHPRVPDS